MSLNRKWYLSILVLIVVSACGLIDQRRMRTISQRKAKNIADILCLPQDLPDVFNPTPEFYWVGEDGDLPGTGIVYRGSNNSPHLLYIIVDAAYLIDDDIVKGYYNSQYCEDKFATIFSPVCDTSRSMIPLYDSDKTILVNNDPAFITNLTWLARKDGGWSHYYVYSTLPLEETKEIGAWMCVVE